MLNGSKGKNHAKMVVKDRGIRQRVAKLPDSLQY